MPTIDARCRDCRFDWNLLLVSGMAPVMTLVACQDWLFDPVGSIDAFKYVGLFFNYDRQQFFAAADYKVSRLAWVLPGFASYKLFGPLGGHYVLQITFIVVSHLFLYLSTRLLFTRSVAVITTALFATNSWFHGPIASASGGWNYHNTASLAYYFASLWFVLKATLDGRRRYSWMAGASMALCVFTSLFMMPFALLLSLLWLASPVGNEETLRGLFRAAAGGLLTTSALGGLNVALGGRFLFFWPEVIYTLSVARQNIWFEPAASYVNSGFWLVYPVLTSLLIAASWLRPSIWFRTSERRLVVCVHSQFIIAFVYVIVLSTVLHQSVLQFPFMMMPLAGPMMPALAACLFTAEGRRPFATGLLVSAVLLAIPVGTMWFITQAVKVSFGTWFVAHLPLTRRLPVLIPLIVATMVLPVISVTYRYSLLVVAALFALVNVASFPRPSSLARDSMCCVNRDAFLAIVEANRFIRRIDPTAKFNNFIYSLDEHLESGSCQPVYLSQLFNSLQSTRFSPRVYNWTDLPAVTQDELSLLQGITVLTSVKNEAAFAETFSRHTGDRGVRFRLVAREKITKRPFVFVVAMWARVGEVDGSR